MIRVDGVPHQIIGVLPDSFNDWRHLGWVERFVQLGIQPAHQLRITRKLTDLLLDQLARAVLRLLTDVGDVIFNGNYNYRSSYSLVELDNLLTQDSYGLLNLGVTWFSNDGHWNIALHGKNLTDEEYLVGNYAFIAPDPANPGQYIPGLGGDNTLIGYYGAPRTVSLSVGYRF